MLSRLTIQRTAIIILFLLLFAMASDVPNDADMWWHLHSGRTMLETGQMIYTDSFSYTFAGEPRVYYDWGGQVILYGLWQIGGINALMLSTAFVAVAGMIILFKTMPGNPYVNALLLVATAAAAAIFWTPRPQMATYFFSTVVIWLLFRYKWLDEDRLWWFVPVMWIWGNIHAGFFVGLLFWGGTVTGEILNLVISKAKLRTVGWRGVRKLTVVGVVGSLVLLINPNGFDLLLVPFETFGLQVLRDYIQEWQPPDLSNPQILPFTFLLILAPASMVMSRRRLDFTELVLLTGTAYLALTASRNIALFVVVAAPIIARHLNDFLQHRGWVIRPVQQPTPQMRRLNVLLIILVAFGVSVNLLRLMNPTTINERHAGFFPVTATEVLKQTPQEGNIFNSYNWGGYLMFHLPDLPVFIDGRTDLYREFVDTYANVAFGSVHFDPLFNEYGIGHALIETGSGLAALLSQANDWSVLYSDDIATIFVHEEPAS